MPWGFGRFLNQASGLDEIWDFFKYLAHDTWEYENARGIFSHHIPNPYVMHAMPLAESQFGGTSYEHPHTLCVVVSCDSCYYFDYDVDSFPLFGQTQRLEALTAFNREL